MSKLHTFGVALALGFLGGAAVDAQETTPQPRPSTSQTEGTAADRTKPGESPTRATTPPEQGQQQQTDPRPSTSETEGTAADRTPPGRTPQEQMGQRGQMGEQRSDMVGAAVVSSKQQQAPVGRVVDMVFDSANQPEFVVIESGGRTVAVPYSVANANKSADKIVIDEQRLQGAPKIKQGAWRSGTDDTWKKDANRYWDRG